MMRESPSVRLLLGGLAVSCKQICHLSTSNLMFASIIMRLCQANSLVYRTIDLQVQSQSQQTSQTPSRHVACICRMHTKVMLSQETVDAFTYA